MDTKHNHAGDGDDADHDDADGDHDVSYSKPVKAREGKNRANQR